MADKRVKPSPEDYEAQIAEASRVGRTGWVEYLAHRFDRDYPPTETKENAP